MPEQGGDDLDTDAVVVRDGFRTEGVTTTAPAPRTRPDTNAGVGSGDDVPSRISPIPRLTRCPLSVGM